MLRLLHGDYRWILPDRRGEAFVPAETPFVFATQLPKPSAQICPARPTMERTSEKTAERGRKQYEEERNDQRIPGSAERREDQGTGQLEGQDALPGPRSHQPGGPEVVEEWKWRGVPVWSHAGIICTGETYKNVVKMTFAKGASLEDPSGLFNSSLEGSTRRAIDFHEGDKIDVEALKALFTAPWH